MKLSLARLPTRSTSAAMPSSVNPASAGATVAHSPAPCGGGT